MWPSRHHQVALQRGGGAHLQHGRQERRGKPTLELHQVQCKRCGFRQLVFALTSADLQSTDYMIPNQVDVSEEDTTNSHAPNLGGFQGATTDDPNVAKDDPNIGQVDKPAIACDDGEAETNSYWDQKSHSC